MGYYPRRKSNGKLDYLLICALLAVAGSAVVQGVDAKLPSIRVSQASAR